MPRPWRMRYAGAKYHLTVRGNGRQVVFREPDDHERFLKQLKEALEQDEVILYAYALMSNHYHLLVETPLGNVQRFMQRLNTAYGMYFRYKHSQVGHCFQGRYGAKLVKGDDYVVRLTRYIHLNPIKVARWQAVGAQERLEYLNAYAWSSYRGYVGLGPKEEMVDYRWLKLMGRRTQRGNRDGYRRYLEEMVAGVDEWIQGAKEKSRYAIGDDRFLEATREELEAARFTKSDTGDIAWPEKRRPALEDVLEPVMKALGLSGEELTGSGRGRRADRQVAVELLCRVSSATQREVAGRLGYESESAVGKIRKAWREQCRKTPALLKGLQRIENQLERGRTG